MDVVPLLKPVAGERAVVYDFGLLIETSEMLDRRERLRGGRAPRPGRRVLHHAVGAMRSVITLAKHNLA